MTDEQRRTAVSVAQQRCGLGRGFMVNPNAQTLSCVRRSAKMRPRPQRGLDAEKVAVHVSVAQQRCGLGRAIPAAAPRSSTRVRRSAKMRPRPPRENPNRASACCVRRSAKMRPRPRHPREVFPGRSAVSVAQQRCGLGRGIRTTEEALVWAVSVAQQRCGLGRFVPAWLFSARRPSVRRSAKMRPRPRCAGLRSGRGPGVSVAQQRCGLGRGKALSAPVFSKRSVRRSAKMRPRPLTPPPLPALVTRGVRRSAKMRPRPLSAARSSGKSQTVSVAQQRCGLGRIGVPFASPSWGRVSVAQQRCGLGRTAGETVAVIRFRVSVAQQRCGLGRAYPCLANLQFIGCPSLSKDAASAALSVYAPMPSAPACPSLSKDAASAAIQGSNL